MNYSSSSYPVPTNVFYKRIVWIILFSAILIGLFIILFHPPIMDVVYDETDTITMIPSDHPKQLVYEDDLVRISIGQDQAQAYIEKWLQREASGVHIGDVKDRVIKLQEDMESTFINDDILELNFREHEYFISDSLVNGRALVIDKRDESQVAKIRVRYYGYTCGILCGQGTETFFFPDRTLFNSRGTEFFEVWLWVS